MTRYQPRIPTASALGVCHLFELFAECPTIKTCEVRSDGLVQHDLFEEGLK